MTLKDRADAYAASPILLGFAAHGVTSSWSGALGRVAPPGGSCFLTYYTERSTEGSPSAPDRATADPILSDGRGLPLWIVWTPLGTGLSVRNSPSIY